MTVTNLAAAQSRYKEIGLKPNQFSACLREEGFIAPWRVVRIDRGWCSLVGFDENAEENEQRARTADCEIAVGDWVWVSGIEEDLQISEFLERNTHLRRSNRDAQGQKWIAANLDTVFVVAAFGRTAKLEGRGINTRRIERYISAVREGGSDPVVVLNKLDITTRDRADAGDLCRDLASRLGTVVLAVSAHDSDSMKALQPYLGPGETLAFIGPSGVGKSSLINAIAGKLESDTGAVRGVDMKGRHTTTHRQLLRVPGGALLIDTPGMRAFSVYVTDDSVPGFEDIRALALVCRFGNCQHTTEPECAVAQAVSDGTLDEDRLDNYRAIAGDRQRTSNRRDPKTRHEEKKAGKKLGRLIKQAKDLKRR